MLRYAREIANVTVLNWRRFRSIAIHVIVVVWRSVVVVVIIETGTGRIDLVRRNEIACYAGHFEGFRSERGRWSIHLFGD